MLFLSIFNGMTLWLFWLGWVDPSSSLGYGMFILGFWVLAALAMVVLISKKYLRIHSFLDKIGIFLSTPILYLSAIWISFGLNNETVVDYVVERGDSYLKQSTVSSKNGLQLKRIEYYTSSDGVSWIKDSTWLYLSELGDTIKRVKFKDGVEVAR